MFYQPGTYEDLHSLGQYLRDGLTLVFAEHELVAQIMGDGPLAQVVFSADSF
jgi:glutamate-1-semialdehyde 2,1-aminomutase